MKISIRKRKSKHAYIDYIDNFSTDTRDARLASDSASDQRALETEFCHITSSTLSRKIIYVVA